MNKIRIDLRTNTSESEVIDDPYKKFDENFAQITRIIDMLGLTQAQANSVYSSFHKLIDTSSNFIKSLSCSQKKIQIKLMIL